MMLTCAYLALSHLVQSEVAIPIQFRRPSSMAEMLGKMSNIISPDAKISSDDEKGRIFIKGLPSDINSVQKYVALMDIPRKRIEISIDIQSPTEKTHNKLNVELYSDQEWTIEDKDMGLKLSLKPTHFLQNGSVAMGMTMAFRDHKEVSQFRLAPGVSAPQTFGKVRLDDAAPNVQRFETSPIITLRNLGLHGD